MLAAVARGEGGGGGGDAGMPAAPAAAGPGGDDAIAHAVAQAQATAAPTGLSVDDLKELLTEGKVDAREFRELRNAIKAGGFVCLNAESGKPEVGQAPAPPPMMAPMTAPPAPEQPRQPVIRTTQPTAPGSGRGGRSIPGYLKPTAAAAKRKDHQEQVRESAVRAQAEKAKLRQHDIRYASKGDTERADLSYVAERAQEETDWRLAQEAEQERARKGGRSPVARGQQAR